MLSRRARGILAAMTVALAAVGASAGTGVAAKAPKTFYGVVPQTPLTTQDFERMGTGKVGTVRVLMPWSAIDSTQADDNQWGGMDAIVLDAARNGIQVLPFIYGTPDWVAKNLDNRSCNGAGCGIYAPKSAGAIAEFARFTGEAVERYGPGGDLWAANPQVNALPIKAWQLLNEMNSKSFYAPKPSAKGYAKILDAASAAIKQRDPSADVVLGGIPELAGSRKAIPGSEYLEDLYDVNGVKSDFDAVASHPYGATIAKVSAQVEDFRDVMKQAGDKGASLYVTEVGAGSASGGNSLNRGEKGQAQLLKDVFKYLLKKRNSFNIETVNWFSWMDSKQSICSWCATSGLLDTNGRAKKSYKEFTKLTGGSTGKR